MSTTLKLSSAEIRTLEQTLSDSGYEFRPLQWAHFQARGPGVVISAYKSGKVVVQGAEAIAFLEAHGFAVPKPKALAGPVAGSDESGKGDYFGPLVVAAVAVQPNQVDDLAQAGVRDSKALSDTASLRTAAAVRQLCPHAVCTLTPEQYNARHAAEGNVALFMSTMHAEAIAQVADGCALVVIDQFTFSERLENALQKQGVDLPVEIRPRAEDNPAVAAASVLARAEFLIGLKELGTEHGVELPKGAGANVEKVAREIFRDGGMDALAAVAKTHFRTTKRVTQDLF